MNAADEEGEATSSASGAGTDAADGEDAAAGSASSGAGTDVADGEDDFDGALAAQEEATQQRLKVEAKLAQLRAELDLAVAEEESCQAACNRSRAHAQHEKNRCADTERRANASRTAHAEAKGDCERREAEEADAKEALEKAMEELEGANQVLEDVALAHDEALANVSEEVANSELVRRRLDAVQRQEAASLEMELSMLDAQQDEFLSRLGDVAARRRQQGREMQRSTSARLGAMTRQEVARRQPFVASVEARVNAQPPSFGTAVYSSRCDRWSVHQRVPSSSLALSRRTRMGTCTRH